MAEPIVTYKFLMTEVNSDEDSFGGLEPWADRHIEYVVTGEQTLPDLVKHFENWLKAMSFSMDRSSIQVVNHDNNS